MLLAPYMYIYYLSLKSGKSSETKNKIYVSFFSKLWITDVGIPFDGQVIMIHTRRGGSKGFGLFHPNDTNTPLNPRLKGTLGECREGADGNRHP